MALYNLGKYKEVIDCYDKALEINPKYANAWDNKGSALHELGKYNEAIECYDNAIRLGTTKKEFTWYNKGVSSLYVQLSIKKSIEYCDKALEINPKYANAWINKGAVLYNLGKYEKAIECYDKALELDPNDAYALNNKRIALNKLGIGTKQKEYDNKVDELGAKKSGWRRFFS